jgi:1,4-alpha-glucan branching enzyme
MAGRTVTTQQMHITPSTPMGATVVDGGTTCRVWAPAALQVHVALGDTSGYQPSPADELLKDPATGHWTGLLPGVGDGTVYRFHVSGGRTSGFKRDPMARELCGSYPEYRCVVRDPASYPWHDAGFLPPAFNDLVIYQFHVGVFSARDDAGQDIRPYRVATFLDALERVEYVADLGINAVQLLPVVEFHGPWSVGYNGTDIFSPEMDYCVDEAEVGRYLPQVNRLLANSGHIPLTASQLSSQPDQLKAFIDIYHLHGIAVVIDVVYNHAGGDLDPQSLDYFDLPASPGADNNLYFSTAGWAGGRVFEFAESGVRAFLTDNARTFLEEYHADGLRFDEVRVITWNGGRGFCQELTASLRSSKQAAVLIAEYWESPRGEAVWRPPAGLGFDVEYSDRFRDGVRDGPRTGVRWRLRHRRHRPTRRCAAAAGGPALRLAGLQLPGEPRPPTRRTRRGAPSTTRRSAGRPGRCPFVVRPEPLTGGDGPAAHGPGRACPLHGPGVPRGQVVVGQSPAQRPHDLVGRDRGRRCRHGRLPPLHPGPRPPAARSSRAPRGSAPRLPRQP